jgi:multidrug efflux pump
LAYTLNFIVLFAFLLALGIVVDDAIVVVENTHRIYHEDKKLTIIQAAKKATGEVFMPVLSGTITTLAPFFPLVFWGGIFGKFMHYMPVTVIITLTASLVVAYIVNPVFAVWFMGDSKREGTELPPAKKRRRVIFGYALFALSTLYFYVNGNLFMGNLLVFIALFLVFYRFVLEKAVRWFQTNGWPAAQRGYAKFLNFALDRPFTMIVSVVLLLFFSLMLFASGKRNIVLFPKADPNFIYVYMTLPVGTDVAVTDSLTRVMEKKVEEVLGKDNPIVESLISNVALGASEDQFDRSATSNKVKLAWRSLSLDSGMA